MAIRRRYLIPLYVLGAVAAVLFMVTAWYGFRVFTELGTRPWRNPTKILAHDGETILEIYGDSWRRAEPVLLEELPEEIPLVFLAAEDVRFRHHPGIDPLGIGRAALANVREGGITQGGSTITQQLAKMKFFSIERTFRRKIMEALVAPLIEIRLSKDDILEAYLNDVYLGHHNGQPVLGIDEGARLYFNTKPEDLSLSQAALLAGMIRAPNRDTVEKNKEVATNRRNAILAVMRDEEWITEDQYDNAVDDPVRFRTGTLPRADHPFPLRALRSELVDRIGEHRLRAGALTIHTTLDLDMQKSAESAVRKGVARLRSRYSWLRRGEEPLEAAILSLDAETGGIRALVGGADWSRSQFDRTRSMRRQAGSALKPFTYVVGIDRKEITPSSVLEDRPIEIELARNDVWTPHNYDERFRGEVTVREAVEKSLNIPAILVAREVGTRRIASLLRKAGLGRDFSSTPAIALGVDEVAMRELAGAYTVFPNLGRRVVPHMVSRVESPGGRTIRRTRVRPRKVLSPQTAYVVHSLMRGVVQRGTASALRRQGLGHIAGKTGTTNDYRDAWFVGYSPDLVTAAWVGFDEGRPLRISSAEAALPIWSAYMSAVPHEKGEIEPPEGVEIVTVERATGLVWRSGCGASVEEAFIRGTAPREQCTPRRKPPVVPEYEEPPVITADKLREWIQEAPGTLSQWEVSEVPIEEAPEGAEPGDIIIQIPPENERVEEPREDPDPERARERTERERERVEEKIERERERAEEKLERERERAQERIERERERIRERIEGRRKPD